MSLFNYSGLVLLLGLSLSFNPSVNAQGFERVIDYPPVYGISGQYNNPFSGGFNNIEYQFIDIDNDGDYDLFFLNSDRTYGWFENTGNKFSPEFKLSKDTITGMIFSDWFYFVDIDGDGDYDLFTGNIEYVRFLRNTGTKATPFFVQEHDTLKDDNGNPILSEFGSNPVFADIDSDGDYDFISGNSAGTVTFYENIGSTNQFNFRFISNFWQNLLIISGSDELRHGSSSLDFADLDGDDDLDLFWGDFFSKSLYFIENQGTPFSPSMQLISNVYPVNADSVWTSGFNMPRFVDLNGDDNLDLFVSVLFDPTVPQSLMFFENTGTPQIPDLVRITDNFLNTLDVGNNSHPVFIDIDNDGDLDLFIGSLNNPFGSLHFFENEGSFSNPVFVYKDSVYAGIQTDLSVVPAFGDLDGDEDSDLLIGKFDGRISYYRNDGNKFNAQFIYVEDLRDVNQSIIDVGTSAAPFLIDIDGDGDLDLVIGAFNGRFYLYKNTGNQNSYSFEYIPDYFAGLDVGDNSTPVLVDYSGDAKLELFSGSRNGNIIHFTNIGSTEQPQWIQSTDQFLNQNFGGYSTIAFIDIDNDSDLDLILGNVKGGLYFYRNLSISNIDDSKVMPVEHSILKAYPNPFNPSLNINVEIKSPGRTILRIYNLLGEKVKELYNEYLDAGKHLFSWDGTNDNYVSLPAGNYFIQLITDNKLSALKVTYLK